MGVLMFDVPAVDRIADVTSIPTSRICMVLMSEVAIGPVAIRMRNRISASPRAARSQIGIQAVWLVPNIG